MHRLRSATFKTTLALLAIGALGAGCQTTDSWPGDREATRKQQAIDRERADDAITLASVDRGAAMTRARLCERLVDRHANLRGRPGPAQSNAEFLACPDLDADRLRHECERALANPVGYAGPDGWRRWAGSHRGTWWNDDGARFDDRAEWSAPRREWARDAGDVDRAGARRSYDFQPVRWPGRSGPAARGWNQSHPEVRYVWGWDPKEGEDANGDVGIHVGYPIELPPCHFIVWITAREAFLEGVNTADPSDRRKTSVGFFGRGQWRIR